MMSEAESAAAKDEVIVAKDEMIQSLKDSLREKANQLQAVERLMKQILELHHGTFLMGMYHNAVPRVLVDFYVSRVLVDFLSSFNRRYHGCCHSSH